MARLIDPKTFDGAQLGEDERGEYLTIWERVPGEGRVGRVVEVDEIAEAVTEIRDLLAGQSDPGEEAAGKAPRRKGRKG